MCNSKIKQRIKEITEEYVRENVKNHGEPFGWGVTWVNTVLYSQLTKENHANPHFADTFRACVTQLVEEKWLAKDGGGHIIAGNALEQHVRSS